MVANMLGMVLALALAATPHENPERGVSEALARSRAAAIADLRYELAFTIPADRRRPVLGRVVVRFALARPDVVVLDFVQPRDRIRAVRIAGRPIEGVRFTDDHIVIPAAATHAGSNEIELQFVAGDEALNRNDDFLYTLFVPARAHFAFPCFDQPDLKARYSLTLIVPDGWQVVANGAEALRREMVPGAEPGTWNDMVPFVETAPLPTYLFAFAAGRFSIETATRDGREFRMFHRETDAAKVARNRDAIFDLHAAALAWLENYTGIRYPFGKFDFVLIPSFQFGGMEHPGAIFYNASALLLEEAATQNQLLDRASTISHETAHMWFGDLVTMRWFNDVWMKEVFANFMAEKIVSPSFPQVNFDLRFLMANYPSAYGVDRTAGTNPIRQPLANLSDAGQLYGAIIYQKAPIVMRQLETTVGAQRFRDGLREYLTRHSFGNASWTDLIALLDRRTPEDLAAWSRAWVEERGRPTFTTDVQLNADGTIKALTLAAADPYQRGLVWTQQLRVAVGYVGRVPRSGPGEVMLLPVNMNRGVVSVAGARGLPRPLYVLGNGAGLGYGLFLLDEASRGYLLSHVEEVPDALTRGAAWITMWDNVLEHRIAPGPFIDAAVRALPRETDEQNVQRVLAYVTRAFWRWLGPDERLARAASLEQALRAGLDRAGTVSQKSAWFNAYRDTVLTPDGVAWLTRVWRRDEKVPGLPFAEADEITMALELAVREVPDWSAILDAQLARTQNPDRKARFAFVMPALSADPATRERAFARFRSVENRRREPWVLESLQYLNHPLREAHARRFVTPALDLLRGIQQTGDIFFPTRWTEATLWGHRSPEAAADVQDFLASQLTYPQRLRWTILSAADELFRVTTAPTASASPSRRRSP
jgi:aminopeptidase N